MKTKLIALVVIFAGTVAALLQDVPAGASFEVPADQAEALLTQGLAKLEDEPIAGPGPSRKVAARVLMDCVHGAIDEAVYLPSAVAKEAAAAGQVDTHKDAVAYAKSLQAS